MNEALRLCSVALYAVGPLVAVVALFRRPSRRLSRTAGWRWYVPAVLLPIEWVLPPVLIYLRVGELHPGYLPLRVAGLVVGVSGAALLVWASVVLGRFLIHESAILEEHVLITTGPYRFVRHPVYTGFLALLLGTGVAALNGWVLLIWPISLLGIIVQATSEERALAERFDVDYERYAGRTGRFVPRLWG